MIQSHNFKQPISYHYDVFRPNVAEATPLLICQHGYGQNKNIAMEFGQHIRRDWAIIAQQAPHKHHKFRDGQFVPCFSWVNSFESQEDITNHHQFIVHCTDVAFENNWTLERKAFLFACSQSVSLSFRFAAKYPEYVAGIIAVAGATPSDWSTKGKQKLPMPVLYICPQDDEAYGKLRLSRFKETLSYHCSDLTWQNFTGGHRVPSKSYKLIFDWLESKHSFSAT